MKLQDLQTKTLGIYGMGVEGTSLFSWLQKHNIKKIFCFDENFPQGNKDFLALDKLPSMDIIFRSPGVHPKKITHFIGEQNKDKISSATQLFFDLSPTKKIIGVTGTKGKGTTSSLIYKMIESSLEDSHKVFLGGNIGTPIFDFFDDISPDDIVVLELSSFQLYDLKSSPFISVLLRTDTEHLDWHSDLNDYRQAKKNIFLYQAPKDTLVYFEGSKIVRDMVMSQKNYEGTLVPYRHCFNNADQKIFSEVGLRGSFHQENILAAKEVANILQIPLPKIAEVIRNFSGLAMRCELVTEKKGRNFFNDSFSTIPQTTISALSTFISPVYLILGGSEKFSDFSALYKYIEDYRYIKKIYLVGGVGDRILDEISIRFSNLVPLVEKKQNFEEIFNDFKKNSSEGDSLLLSPACASFGMFRNYKHRGEEFNRLAENF